MFPDSVGDSHICAFDRLYFGKSAYFNIEESCIWHWSRADINNKGGNFLDIHFLNHQNPRDVLSLGFTPRGNRHRNHSDTPQIRNQHLASLPVGTRHGCVPSMRTNSNSHRLVHLDQEAVTFSSSPRVSSFSCLSSQRLSFRSHRSQRCPIIRKEI